MDPVARGWMALLAGDRSQIRGLAKAILGRIRKPRVKDAA
jgi:hypothetical protein